MKNRLKEIRQQHNKSQADVARELGVSRQAVNGFESGKFDPSLEMAFKLSRLLSVTIEDMFLYEAQPPLSTTIQRGKKYFGRERFVAKAMNVIKFAGNEAALQRISWVQPQHLFDGLLADPTTTSARLLHTSCVTRCVPTDDHSFELRGAPKLSPDSKKILDFALVLAQDKGMTSIGTEHLRWGLLKFADADPKVAEIFRKYGAEKDTLQTQLNDVL